MLWLSVTWGFLSVLSLSRVEADPTCWSRNPEHRVWAALSLSMCTCPSPGTFAAEGSSTKARRAYAGFWLMQLMAAVGQSQTEAQAASNVPQCRHQLLLPLPWSDTGSGPSPLWSTWMIVRSPQPPAPSLCCGATMQGRLGHMSSLVCVWGAGHGGQAVVRVPGCFLGTT